MYSEDKSEVKMALPLGFQVCVLTIEATRQRSGKHQVQQIKGMKLIGKGPIVATMLFGMLMLGTGTVQGRGDYWEGFTQCRNTVGPVPYKSHPGCRREPLTSASLPWPTTD